MDCGYADGFHGLGDKPECQIRAVHCVILESVEGDRAYFYCQACIDFALSTISGNGHGCRIADPDEAAVHEIMAL